MCGVDIFNSIYIDGICDIGSVLCDIFNIEQVEVIKGLFGIDYGCSVLIGLINMISKQLCNDFGIDVFVSIGSVWFCCGMLDVNQVIGDIIVVRLNVMGEKMYDVGCDKVKNECYGVVFFVVFGFGIVNCLYFNYLYVIQYNMLDGGILIIGLLGYFVLFVGMAVLNYFGKVDIYNFYGMDFDYDDLIIDIVIMCFEYDINDNIIICNIICWLCVKQDYLMMVIMGGVLNIIQFISDVNSWIWLCMVNIKDVSNKIFINQINLILMFYIGFIGYDVSIGVEFICEMQINYGVNLVMLFVVNIYYFDSSIYFGGLMCNGVNVNGQMDIFVIYVFDML